MASPSGAAAAPCYSSAPSSISRRLPLLSSHSRCQVPFNQPLGVSLGLKTTRKSRSPFRVFCVGDTRADVVTGKSWNKLILENDAPVLVEFHASWCGPCRMVHRVIDEIATEYSGRLKCYVVDTDVDLNVAKDYDIKAVPVVLLFKNGEKCDSVIGTMPKEFYVAAIERVLAS